MDWFKFDINGYLADDRIQELTPPQEQFYFRLIINLYKFDGYLPLNSEILRRLARLKRRAEAVKRWDAVAPLFVVTPYEQCAPSVKNSEILTQLVHSTHTPGTLDAHSIISHIKVTKTLQLYGKSYSKRAAAGQKGGLAKRSNARYKESESDKEPEVSTCCDYGECRSRATLSIKGGPQRCISHLPSMVG